VGVARSTYYYYVNKKHTQRAASGGRPAPVCSYTVDGTRVSDEKIKNWLLELIEKEDCLRVLQADLYLKEEIQPHHQ
jgi:hypothetical protein